MNNPRVTNPRVISTMVETACRGGGVHAFYPLREERNDASGTVTHLVVYCTMCALTVRITS